MDPYLLSTRFQRSRKYFLKIHFFRRTLQMIPLQPFSQKLDLENTFQGKIWITRQIWKHHCIVTGQSWLTWSQPLWTRWCVISNLTISCLKLSQVRTGTYRQLFHPSQLITGKEVLPVDRNWFCGFYMACVGLRACIFIWLQYIWYLTFFESCRMRLTTMHEVTTQWGRNRSR